MARDFNDDSDVECLVAISKADFVGNCLRCGQPTTGDYDSDRDGDDLHMRCVSCGFKQDLELIGLDRFLELRLTFSG